MSALTDAHFIGRGVGAGVARRRLMPWSISVVMRPITINGVRPVIRAGPTRKCSRTSNGQKILMVMEIWSITVRKGRYR